ncbi:MAG: disulfide bond formation protein B [Gemmobacter sp.]|jgi:disulfide bond formation protein DsbB|nr:disulfide bond formation protein B [Gemmobacter sp.]
MTPTRQQMLIAVAAGGSALLLAGALAFQYLGGLAPCTLCIWQRWPHVAAVLIGLAAFTLGGRLLPLLGALAALTTAGIGLFHVGVEQKWWEGLASCSGGSITGISTADLLDPTVTVGAVVRCDAIAWQMAGISMAGWNMIASLLLALIWLTAVRRA